jgi:bifunctional aspartokinase / homoserine dehydrogenase 1
MATATRMRQAADLMVAEAQGGAKPSAVVVSAMGSTPESPVKVTDLLINMVSSAAATGGGFEGALAALQGKHADAARDLLGASSPACAEYLAALQQDMDDLKAMCRAIAIAGTATDAFVDYVVGHGELWSARLFAAACADAAARAAAADGGNKAPPMPVAFMDARDVLVVTPTSDGASVDLDERASNAKLDAWFDAKRKASAQAAGPGGPIGLMVVTGFIAKNPQGQVTTLKRNGSDLSATVIGALLRGGHITIWTDVDGVYSADPRKVPDTVCLPSLTYHEAWELSYFGANVLHPRTTLPAMKYGIPIAIRNFFNLSAPGTQVSDLARDAAAYSSSSSSRSSSPALGAEPGASPADARRGMPPTVKGFATIDHVSLINIEGTGMVGVPGIASAVFSTVRDAGVNVIMISQASSEHSICFAVKAAEATTAVEVLSKRFADAIGAGRVSAVERIDECCVLAAVGQGMVNRKGVAATMMSALARANVNIKAIAQGSSEYNITVLIGQADSEKALRAVHSRFYLSDVPMGVAVVGPGLIGGALLEQLREQRAQLRDQFGIDIRVLGIASSKRMLLSETGVDLDDWRGAFNGGGGGGDGESGSNGSKSNGGQRVVPADLEQLGKHLASSYIPNLAVIDCTASDAPAAHYLEWMRQGVHVITPNKKLGSGPLDRYRRVRNLQRERMTHFFYEATVGAGLPVIGTLKHLVETGDRVVRIEGVFSGTLSYIFNTFGSAQAPGLAFSQVVAEAKAKGYTEPDPRDDLSGTDVARKVAILAREAGLGLELDDIPVESLVPGPLQSVATAGEYLSRLPDFDGEMEAKLRAAEADGEVLRYVGVVDAASGKGSVELRRYPRDHPFAQLQGSDNIIAFTTARYFKQPLIVRGPGAGADVTAGGVFSDLLRLAAHLGAPS